MKYLEIYGRIMKIIKNKKNPYEVDKIYENQINIFENNENHENHRNPYYNKNKWNYYKSIRESRESGKS